MTNPPFFGKWTIDNFFLTSKWVSERSPNVPSHPCSLYLSNLIRPYTSPQSVVFPLIFPIASSNQIGLKCHWKPINLTCFVDFQVKFINRLQMWNIMQHSYICVVNFCIWLVTKPDMALRNTFALAFQKPPVNFLSQVCCILSAFWTPPPSPPCIQLLGANTRSGPFVFPVSSLTPHLLESQHHTIKLYLYLRLNTNDTTYGPPARI